MKTRIPLLLASAGLIAISACTTTTLTTRIANNARKAKYVVPAASKEAFAWL